MFPPQFIVTSLGPFTRNDINRFTGTGNRLETWKVGMVHSYQSGQSIDLYFPTEAQAKAFSLWKPYTQEEILKLAGNTSSTFEVRDIGKTKQSGPTNKYTGKPTIIESWRAALDNFTDGRTINWAFPTESEVREKFDQSKAYTLRGMFGTLPSVPEPVTQAYLGAAENAVQAAKEKEKADYERQQKSVFAQEKAAKALGATAATYYSDYQKSIKRAAQAQAGVSAARAKEKAAYKAYMDAAATNPRGSFDLYQQYTSAMQAREQAESYANLVSSDVPKYEARYNQAKVNAANAAAKAKNLAKGLDSRTIPEGINQYTIAEGGAEGYYNGVYYKEGTFPVNGQWTGIYKVRL